MVFIDGGISMRTFKYAIWRFLYPKPMTGYNILLEFEKGLSDFWNTKHSQIHPGFTDKD